MPFGDPGGNMQGGYGGNFPGYGGSSMASQPGGPAHGSLGFGGMSPGGYNSTTYSQNAAGINAGQAGFGARVEAARAARNRALQQQQRAQQGSTSPAARQAALDANAAQTGPTVVAPEPVPGIDYSQYRAPFNPSMDQAPGWESAFPNGNFIAPTRQEWSSPSPGSGLGFGGAENWNNAQRNAIGQNNLVLGGGPGRQFGGPVAPGGRYTVGENGPETLQMGAQGGQVIPNNPIDKLGGMNPQMMQALLQLMQQQKQPQPPQMPQPSQKPQVPQMPQMQPPKVPGGPMGQGPGAGGGFRLGDWKNRMGIEGLSRPAKQPGMGFGGSGLGMPGILPHMAKMG